MYTTEILFQGVGFPLSAELRHMVMDFLGALRQNGQILGREHSFAIKNGQLAIYVKIPDIDSLSSTYHNRYVLSWIDQLKEKGALISRVQIIGEDPASMTTCRCQTRDSLILFTEYAVLESPLRCGDCFHPVPLYKIPKTYDDEYYDILCWMTNYQACVDLQMNCRVGECFGRQQLAKCDSALSRQGIEICSRIEQQTGTPTYYCLLQEKGANHRKKKDRFCPICGGDWMLSRPMHELFDYRCRNCRLLMRCF